MQATFRLIPILALTLALAGFAVAQDKPAPEVSDDAKAAAAANNAFAIDLYKSLVAGETDNTFFSPFSIESALGMTLVGAQGDTLSEMSAVLHAPKDGFHKGLGELTNALTTAPDAGADEGEDITPPGKRIQKGLDDQLEGNTDAPKPAITPKPLQPKPEVNPFKPPTLPGIDPVIGAPSDPTAGQEANHLIRIANRLWPQTGFTFKVPFMDTVTANYGAGVQELDYAADPDAAKDVINGWVEEQTKDKNGEPMIKDLIKKLSGATRMVLTNAIYFKGDWASKFDKANTQEDGKFTTLDGSIEENVPLMNQTESFGYANIPGVGQLLDLPYQANALSMVVFLPEERGAAGLKAFEDKLTVEALTHWSLRTHRREVQVTLPRFELESEFELGDALTELGMPSAFDPSVADFRGMASKVVNGEEINILNIDKVIHKAVARVDEEGSEMAAATAVIVVESTSALPTLPPVFRADRPFVFMVRDNATGAILFMGRVLNPKG